MTVSLDHINFFTKEIDQRWPQTLAELVQGWIEQINNQIQPSSSNDEYLWAFECAGDLVKADAELGLQFVLSVLATKPNTHVIEVLAAGPLEDLLAHNGLEIIDQVELEARRSPELRHLLGGVWQNDMSDEIWQRVLKAAPERW